MSKSTVFISYRRSTGKNLARQFYDELKSWGINAFFDVKSLRTGEFWLEIERQIINRDVFLVFLTEDALESEAVRKETQFALRHKKQIIPIYEKGFNPYENFHEEVKALSNYNAIEYDYENPEICYKKLRPALGIRRIPIVPIISTVIVLIVVISTLILLLKPLELQVAERPIIFAMDKFDENGLGIYSIDPISGNLILIYANDAASSYPTMSPDGSQIAFHNNSTGNWDVWIVNSNGSEARNLGDGGSAAWSPDSNRIAFNSGRDGDDEIYVMDTSGNVLNQLTNNNLRDGGPQWSPDGSRILYYSGDPVNYHDLDLWLMDTDGSNKTRLTNNDYYEATARWSPDGSQIVFERIFNGEGQLMIMNADGNNERLLIGTVDGYPPGNAVWSYDGTQIAYEVKRGDEPRQIRIINTDGSNIRLITPSQYESLQPDW